MPTHYPGTPQETASLDAFIKLTRANNSLMARLIGHEILGCITESQFGVLETLLHLGPLNQSELGSKLLKSGGNITLVIDNLEKQGLVHRDVSPNDRRITIVTLTERGDELIKRLFPQWVEAIVEEFGALTYEELLELGRLCKKLGKREKVARPV